MKRLHISLLIFILLALPSMSFAEEDTWTRKADIPTRRYILSTSVVNGKIYAIGGTPSDLSQSTPIVEVYDPATDTWTRKADMLTARWALATSVVNGKIYAIGGTQDSVISFSTVEEYDPVTDTWAKKADMPTPGGDLSASVVNGYIYAIGGLTGWSGSGFFSIIEEYDTGVGIRVRAISLEEGRVTGGEPIAIFGKEFPPGASVTIGGKPLTELKVTDTLITGVTSPRTEGEWNILITAPSIDFTVFAGKFFYYPLSGIVVRRVIPTNGKQAGGDTGSITGRGFLPGATVTIGGVPATDVGVTSTLITFTIPPGTSGADSFGRMGSL